MLLDERDKIMSEIFEVYLDTKRRRAVGKIFRSCSDEDDGKKLLERVLKEDKEPFDHEYRGNT